MLSPNGPAGPDGESGDAGMTGEFGQEGDVGDPGPQGEDGIPVRIIKTGISLSFEFQMFQSLTLFFLLCCYTSILQGLAGLDGWPGQKGQKGNTSVATEKGLVPQIYLCISKRRWALYKSKCI